MVDRNANIDFLFRNGLRDFEVLPPADAWDVVRPAVRKKQQPLILLKTAAAIASLIAVGFLAYSIMRNAGDTFRDEYLALEQESVRESQPLAAVPVRVSAPDLLTSPVADRSSKVAERIAANEVEDNETILSPVTENLRETRSISLFRGMPLMANLSGDRASVTADQAEVSVYPSYELTLLPYEEPKEKISRWSIAAMASPTYYPRPQMGSDELARQIMASEQAQISYSGGLALAYNISRKLSIQSGIYYSEMGQEVAGINSFSGFRQYDLTKGDHNFEVLTSSGRIYTSNSDVFLLDGSGDRVLTRYTRDVFDPAKASLPYMNSSLHQSYSYLEMPVILRYKLVDRSIDFNVIGGLSYNMLVNNNVYTMADGSRYSVGETDGLSHFMVSSSLGMGMEYNISKNFSLNLEPTFRYYMNPFTQLSGLRGRPYSIGIFSGLSYKF